MIKGSVTVAYVHEDVVSESFQQSLMSLIGHDVSSGGRVARGGWLAVRCAGGDALPKARNEAVANFLDGPGEWLLWVDSDMGFQPDIIDRFLEVADPEYAPVIGALCFAYKQVAADGMGGWVSRPIPTIFEWKDESGFESISQYPVGVAVRCAGTGSACIIIHRSVLEKMRNNVGYTWYDRVHNPINEVAGKPQYFGEDLSFCMRLGTLGVPLYVHTGIKTTHHKPTWVGESDYWRMIDQPPATEPVDIIVPVMHRPQNAKPFMDSLRASTALCQVYAVCDQGDTKTIKAWQDAGALTIVMPKSATPGTFAEKVNYAYSHEIGRFKDTRPWLFITGDDVSFKAGWLDHAQAVATNADVVGTNDMGNPRVVSGEHATHLLIRRSYVDESGASWDGPGVVCHEGYKHCYVDDEIVIAAKQRGRWAMALGSRVEHLHPLWGKGMPDKTYRIGQSHMTEDRATFETRLKENLNVYQAE